MKKLDKDTVELGDVYWVDFENINGNRHGARPAVVFQNNTGNKFSPNVVVLPLTTTLRKSRFITHVFLPKGVVDTHRDSVILCENPTCITKEQMRDKIGHLPDRYIAEMAAKSILASSAISFMTPQQVTSVYNKAFGLNGVTMNVQ